MQNYTMIHEDSEWLCKQKPGARSRSQYDSAYWDARKADLSEAMGVTVAEASPLTSHIRDVAAQPEHGFTPLPGNVAGGGVPSLRPGQPTLYAFPTQFNAFGQRTRSGASLVDWERVQVPPSESRPFFPYFLVQPCSLCFHLQLQRCMHVALAPPQL